MKDAQAIARQVDSVKRTVDLGASDIAHKEAALRLAQHDKEMLAAALAAKERELGNKKVETVRTESDIKATPVKHEQPKVAPSNDRVIKEKQTEIERIHTQIKVLEAKVNALTAEIQRARAVVPAPIADAQGPERELKAKQQKLLASKTELKRLEADIQQMKMKLDMAERGERTIADALAALRREHDSDKRELARLQGEYGQAVREKSLKTRI